MPSSASEVRSFSEMLRMAPRLQRCAPSMQTAELTEVCAAAARVKFYDAGLLEAVTSQLRRRIRSRSNGPGVDGIITVLCALAYDSEFFAASARVLDECLVRLGPEQTSKALSAFKAVKHNGDVALIEALTRKSKSERYETAKNELWRRQIGRMYGETVDLQGAPMDAERALLRHPRTSHVRTRGH